MNNNLNDKLCADCPRKCSAKRSGNLNGVCGVPYQPVVARAAPHFWEEPCISGEKGSGAVFFSGCPLKCVFCQNKAISRDGFGKQITAEHLREIFENLIENSVHNINLVTPTQFTDAILEALSIGGDLPVPVVYNCGGYENVETLKRLEGKIQIYLPDMKYSDSACAARYSKAGNYPEIAKAAIMEMFRQTGKPEFDNNGMLIKGTVIRHMVLPDNLENTYGVIDWVAKTFPKGSVLFSLMSQYTPVDGLSENYPEINRRLTAREYDKCCDYLYDSGIEDGFMQELSSAKEEYTPPFNLEGV